MHNGVIVIVAFNYAGLREILKGRNINFHNLKLGEIRKQVKTRDLVVVSFGSGPLTDTAVGLLSIILLRK